MGGWEGAGWGGGGGGGLKGVRGRMIDKGLWMWCGVM